MGYKDETPFILNSNVIRQNCIGFLNSLPLTNPWLVTIKECNRRRSLPQNSLYWTWLTIMANESGFIKDDLHDCFKVDILGMKDLQYKGKTVQIPRSTTELNTKQFGEFLDEVGARASSNGIILPQPRDMGYA